MTASRGAEPQGVPSFINDLRAATAHADAVRQSLPGSGWQSLPDGKREHIVAGLYALASLLTAAADSAEGASDKSFVNSLNGLSSQIRGMAARVAQGELTGRSALGALRRTAPVRPSRSWDYKAGSDGLRDCSASLRSLTAALNKLIRGTAPGASEAQPRAPQPTAAARRLISAASLLLPPADRPRYIREFQSELFEVTAAEDSTRRMQIAYATRVFLKAPSLRGDLKAPRSAPE